jgi:hypothetical protein
VLSVGVALLRAADSIRGSLNKIECVAIEKGNPKLRVGPLTALLKEPGFTY